MMETPELLDAYSGRTATERGSAVSLLHFSNPPENDRTLGSNEESFRKLYG